MTLRECGFDMMAALAYIEWAPRIIRSLDRHCRRSVQCSRRTLRSNLALGFLAAILSFVLCAVVRRIGRRGSAMIAPREDRWHSVATPSMGGLGFGMAALVATAA